MLNVTLNNFNSIRHESRSFSEKRFLKRETQYLCGGSGHFGIITQIPNQCNCKWMKIGVWPFESFYLMGDIGAGSVYSVFYNLKIAAKHLNVNAPGILLN